MTVHHPTDLTGMDPQAMLAELLESGDARRQMLAQLLASQRPVETRSPEPDVSDDDRRRRARAARIKRHLAALEDEVDELRHRNDALASALGACQQCWGEHSDCTVCGGRGRPGWYRPDLAGARQLLGPAIDRLRFEQRRSRPLSPPTTNGGSPSPGPGRPGDDHDSQLPHPHMNHDQKGN